MGRKPFMILAQIAQNPQIQAILKEAEDSSHLVFEGLWDCPKAVLIALIQKATGKSVLVVKGMKDSRLYEDVSCFSTCALFEMPSGDLFPTETSQPSRDISGERLRVLNEIQKAHSPVILFSPLQSCLQKYPSKQTLQAVLLKRSTLLQRLL